MFRLVGDKQAAILSKQVRQHGVWRLGWPRRSGFADNNCLPPRVWLDAANSTPATLSTDPTRAVERFEHRGRTIVGRKEALHQIEVAVVRGGAGRPNRLNELRPNRTVEMSFLQDFDF